ncbi:MAG TPA: TIGR00730 family Rossman fold protein [Acidobacteriota bacterium]|nr:TIGR00730 family Rossman fold protein [Acidobacteriota bacterium]
MKNERIESTGEREFLEGPKGRAFELGLTLRIMWDFLRGFRRLHFAGPTVTVFGSARFEESHPYYQMARETGRRLASAGFTVMTGGGPGIMEAANRGAKDVGGHSVGANIVLPFEQDPNPYLDLSVDFRYFFVRKVMLIKYSYGFIVLPGGFGTLDEVFETLTLIQTGTISGFPIVVMGADYWKPILSFVEQDMVREGTIGPEDPRFLMTTDSPEQAVEMIRSTLRERFGVALPEPPRPRWFLGET